MIPAPPLQTVRTTRRRLLRRPVEEVWVVDRYGFHRREGSPLWYHPSVAPKRLRAALLSG